MSSHAHVDRPTSFAWPTAWSAHRFALAAVLAAVVGMGLASLLRTPAPFIDEVWFANRAWTYLHTGHNFGTIDEGVWDHFDGYWTYFPWLPSVVEALAFRVFGLSLFALRLTSLAFGMLLLGAVYAIAQDLGGRRLALLAVLLVGLSRAFVFSSHLGRPDVMGAAFGFGAVALYITDRSRGVSPASVLSGLAVGLAFESHPFGSIYGPILLALYLLDYGWRLPRVPRFWGFGLGVAAGLAFYAALHVLPYPQTYMAINTIAALGAGAVRTPPLLVPDLAVWRQSVVDMAVQFGSLWNLRLPLIAGGVVVLWRGRRSTSDRRLLVLCVMLLAAYLVLIRNKNPWYAILVSPAGDLLAAAFLLWVSRFEWRRLMPALHRSVGVAVFAGLLAAAVVPTLARMVDDPLGNYQTTLDGIRAAVPPGSAVMGPATYWFGLTDERYVSWEQLVYYRRYAPGSTVEDAARAIGVRYFIVDPYIDKFFRDTPRPSVNDQQLLLPRAEVESFLSRRGRLAATIDTPTYGAVRVYALDWGDQNP